jgi:hypothetical protein
MIWVTDNMEVAGANWPLQFRYRGSRRRSAVAFYVSSPFKNGTFSES